MKLAAYFLVVAISCLFLFGKEEKVSLSSEETSTTPTPTRDEEQIKEIVFRYCELAKAEQFSTIKEIISVGPPQSYLSPDQTSYVSRIDSTAPSGQKIRSVYYSNLLGLGAAAFNGIQVPVKSFDGVVFKNGYAIATISIAREAPVNLNMKMMFFLIKADDEWKIFKISWA